MIFTDRSSAGAALGARVGDHLCRLPAAGRPLILAVPRGGVPVAAAVARAVDGDLDLLVARKIGLPGQPELGIGAVTADGPPVFDPRLLANVGLTIAELAPLVAAERSEAARRLRCYRAGLPAVEVAGRVVVVVDDGLATGGTARAALRSVRAGGPAHLAFAAPVCAPGGVEALATEADAVICVLRPAAFGAVGRWYRRFPQLSDGEVRRVLAGWRAGPSRRG